MANKRSDSAIARAAKERGNGVSSRGSGQFSAVDAGSLHRFLNGAMGSGALVSFASTRNHSAVVLTILHDDIEGGKYKDYFDETGLYEEIEYWAGVFGE